MEILIRGLVLKFIRFYQRNLSPDSSPFSLLHPFYGACKFKPTCSEYAYSAIEKYGLFKGTVKSISRILRCHPFSKGGWDPLK